MNLTVIFYNYKATHSKLVVQLAKESVNASFETTLAQGINYERRLFHATFGK